MTFSGAVVGCDPMVAGPRGLARWRNESLSSMLIDQKRSFNLLRGVRGQISTEPPRLLIEFPNRD